MPAAERPPEPVTAAQMMLGAVLLELVSDWDSWVSRRVDSFYFAGDDERVLCRRQSVDFRVPRELTDVDPDLIAPLGGFPVPLTFVNKWRLPEFSLRDERDGAIPLVARQDSVPIAAGMLLALGTWVVSGGVHLVPQMRSVMPRGLRSCLYDIVSSDPVEGLRLCADLGPGADPELKPEEHRWRAQLATNETFMSLAYELARGFPMLAVLASPCGERRIWKFSYNSYVVPTSRERVSTWRHHRRRKRKHGVPDITDSQLPTPEAVNTGQLVLSSLCDETPRGLREGGPAVAAALATISHERGWSRAVRLRPTGALVIDVPAGHYTMKLDRESGFGVTNAPTEEFEVFAGGETRIHIRTKRDDVTAPVTLAPRLARPASFVQTLVRGSAWQSKPLVVRIRLGDGGSYHGEFEAPPGLHVTRARLVSNADEAGGEQHAKGEVADLVLASTQRSHLYAPAHHAKPATGYAFLDLRARVETIARPAFFTAFAATGMLAFVSAFWHAHTGFKRNGPDDSTALLVVILGGPSALAAYFAQAVHSRVTNAMLYGLRLLALLPAALSLAAGAIMLVGQHREWSHWVLWGFVVLSGVTTAALGVAAYFAEGHPREQRMRDATPPPLRQEPPVIPPNSYASSP